LKEIETEDIDISELENNPAYTPYSENWYERRQRLERLQKEAEKAFFSHNFDLAWMLVTYIPRQFRNEHLTCCWCKDTALFYQMRPAKALFCQTCVRKLRRIRTKQRSQQSKDRAKTRQDNEEFEQILEDQIRRSS
jgi:hypothetical protein